MNDLAYGSRDRRGDWRPNSKFEIAPVFRWPFKPMAFLKWLPDYLLPWNLLFAVSAVLYWHFVVPGTQTLASIDWHWVLRLYLVNCALVFVFYCAIELKLYVRRAQADRFKFDGRFPADRADSAFLLKSQNIEGMLRTFLSGVPI